MMSIGEDIFNIQDNIKRMPLKVIASQYNLTEIELIKFLREKGLLKIFSL